MSGIRLYLRYFAAALKTQLAYRASFVMLSVASLLSVFTEFLAMLAFFDRFGGLKGWNLHEVALFYGMCNLAFALCEMLMGGFDTFGRMVKGGDFDRVLLRPRSTVLQVLGADIQLRRIGRLTMGLAASMWAVSELRLAWGVGEILLFIGAVLGGSMLFGGVILIQATSCFWTIESLELFNMVTYGGVQTAQYPMDIYGKWLRRFFTGVIPLAALNYWPCSVLLNRNYVPPALGWLSPLVGPLFFLIGLAIWRFGVSKYRSTGS